MQDINLNKHISWAYTFQLILHVDHGHIPFGPRNPHYTNYYATTQEAHLKNETEEEKIEKQHQNSIQACWIQIHKTLHYGRGHKHQSVGQQSSDIPISNISTLNEPNLSHSIFDKVSDTLIFPYFFSSRKIVWLIIYTIFPIPTFSNDKLQITEHYSFHFSKEHFKLLHSSLFLIIFQSPTTDYPHITNVSQLSQKPEIVHSSCTQYSQFPHSQISNFK